MTIRFLPSFLIIFFSLLITPTASASLNQPMLNEFLAHPSSGSDWIEIYNPSAQDLDLSGWVLVDSTSTMKTLSGRISASGFLTFDVSNRLNNSGDSIYLKDPAAEVVDNYSYTSDPGIDISVGRSPDGGSWAVLTTGSKGLPNLAPSTLTTAPANMVDTASPSQIPSLLTLTPSPSVTQTPTPTPLPDWVIGSLPSILNVAEIFSVSVGINNLQPNTLYYLKGAFVKPGSTNYFGKTQVSGSWVKNNQSYSLQLPVLTDGLGSFNDQINLMANEDDSGFVGNGEYILKIGRYSQSGAGPTWSDNFTISIMSLTPTQTQEPPTPTSSVTSSPVTLTSSQDLAPIKSSFPTVSLISNLTKPTITKTKLPLEILAASSSSSSSSPILGISTQSAQIGSRSKTQTLNLFIISGLIFIATGLTLLASILFKGGFSRTIYWQVRAAAAKIIQKIL